MKVSLQLFGYPPEHYGPVAQAAEAAGFDSLWLAEHLVTPLTYERVYPYSESGDPGFQTDTPLVDSWVTIGHLAALTSRIRLGTGVFVLPLRNPVVVAKAVATAQQLSGGRVLFGIGTGWMREEFDAAGEPWEGRGGRTDEAIEVIRALWSGRPVAHEGRWYRIPLVQMAPTAKPAPPLIVGGASPPALERAARLGDGWYGPSCPLEESAAYRDWLVRRLEQLDRDPRGFACWARLNEASAAGLARAAELGLGHLVVSVPYRLASLEEKLHRVSEIAALLGLKDAGR